MSQDDSINATDPEPQPPDAPLAFGPRRPGEMRSAAPALCLFCANLLLGAVLLSGSLWPTLFALPQPQSVPGSPPTATATSAIGVQATDAPSQGTVLPAVQATAHATAQATGSVTATATTTSSVQQPTATPPTSATASPTPIATQKTEG